VVVAVPVVAAVRVAVAEAVPVVAAVQVAVQAMAPAGAAGAVPAMGPAGAAVVDGVTIIAAMAGVAMVGTQVVVGDMIAGAAGATSASLRLTAIIDGYPAGKLAGFFVKCLVIRPLWLEPAHQLRCHRKPR
jgi:hypothetical protein